MRISNIAALFLVSIFCFDTLAQQPKAHFDIDTGFFSGPPVVVVNGKKFKPGFWSAGRYKIAEEMKDNPQAFEFAKQHEKYANWGGIALWGGVGCAITYLFTTPDPNYGVYWGIFGVGFVSSLVLNQTSRTYLSQAIDTYNGSPKTSQFEFSILPIKNGATLGLTYAF